MLRLSGLHEYANIWALTSYVIAHDLLLAVNEVINQTRETVFHHHISKHWEESRKYDAQRSIFDQIQGVWKCQWNTASSVWYIFSLEIKTKE